MAQHPPSHYRALVQDAKAGRRPVPELVEEARTVGDPSFAAEALFFLSQDARVPAATAANLADEAFKRLDSAEREWRKAEVLADWAHRGPKWRDDDRAAAVVRERIQQQIAERCLRLAPGKPRSALLHTLGKWRPDSFADRLLQCALANGETADQDAKAILRAGPVPGLAQTIEAHPDAAVKARLLAFLHVHGGAPLLDAAMAAARSLPPPHSLDAMRAIVATLEVEGLRELHRLLPPEPELRARLLSAMAGRADKLGATDQAGTWFQEGITAAQDLGGPQREAVLANLAQGQARLGGKPAPPKDAKPRPVATDSRSEAVPVAAKAGSHRHVLALCDTYEGGLGETHLRAVARAAPLCWAFDLDLALIGFPTKDIDRVARQAARETSIGDGGRHVDDLAKAGRIVLVECEGQALPTDWSAVGLPVATTPEPDPTKRVDLQQAAAAAKTAGLGRVCLVMGLGKNGLPSSWLKGIPHHLEITGRNVSLETATAMGILAERLRQLPLV